MNKKLDISGITNDLEGSAFFPARQSASPPVSEQTPLPSPTGAPHSLPPQVQSPQPERANARTTQRPNGKRIITRNSFEVYEDQMESLRKLSFQDKMEGKLGSMSAMVREAIETYLEKRAKEKQTERPNG